MGSDPLDAGELGLITRDVALRTGAQTGLLAVWNSDERLVNVAYALGVVENGAPALTHRFARRAFVGRVLESGHAAVEPIDPDQDSSLGIQASGLQVRYAAGAAVRPPGGPPGALCVGFSTPPADPGVTLWTVESYARLASLCTHDPGVLEGLLAAAQVDGLTGCLNHVAIHEALAREIERCARHGRTVSCCFIDLDRFKRVNDVHGHPDGSRVLAQVAAHLRSGLRVGDTLGRYGGDEFIAILPDTDRTAAGLLAERLRSTISTTVLHHGIEPIDASIGVAQWRPGSTADELLASADAALLNAKRAGGGLVIGATMNNSMAPERTANASR